MKSGLIKQALLVSIAIFLLVQAGISGSDLTEKEFWLQIWQMIIDGWQKIQILFNQLIAEFRAK